jgi:hypothetical protein
VKLTIELVPSSCWYSNLRNKVAPPVWDAIRKKAYKDAGYRCAICGAPGRLFCHELWQYDDDRHIQSLVGFIALCELCHMVKHIGFAGIRAMDGELDYDALIEHFMAVNKCSREDFEVHKALAFEVWERRSTHEWFCDLGKYKGLISR